MKNNILKLKGAQALSSTTQKTIHGGRKMLAPGCQVGCGGLSQGSNCYGSPDCGCPGTCKNSPDGSGLYCLMY